MCKEKFFDIIMRHVHEKSHQYASYDISDVHPKQLQYAIGKLTSYGIECRIEDNELFLDFRKDDQYTKNECVWVSQHVHLDSDWALMNCTSPVKFFHYSGNEKPIYCPWCGKKIYYKNLNS